MNHKKPSSDELKQGIKAAEDALETPPAPVTPPETPPAPVTPPAPPVSPETPPETPPAPVIPPETPPAPVTPPVDYKKKFAESTREAQVQGFKNKEIQRAVDAAAEITEPTEEDLKVEYPEWDDLTATEQKLAKDNLLNKRRFELVHEATAKFKKVDEWNEAVDGYVGDPKTLIAHPELEGKIEEFKQFASKPTRRGTDIEDLVLAFAGEQAKVVTPPHKGGMFPAGSAGLKTPVVPVDDKLSVEEGRALMKTNYKLWKEKLLAGKIKNE